MTPAVRSVVLGPPGWVPSGFQGGLANDFAISWNGAALVTDAALTVPPINSIRIGSAVGGSFGNMIIRKIALAPYRIPNDILQRIGAP